MKIVFEPYVLDVECRQLTSGDRQHHLSRKAFDLLVALAVARPTVVTKSDLQQQLWPTTFVDEANLANLIAEVRDALGDDPRHPAFIRTVHRIGYSFCADAVTVPNRIVETPERPTCWLEWQNLRLPLTAGEYVIGRDADVAVSLDESMVSRRHARVRVTTDGAVLEDLASKNGTFHNGARVNGAVALCDGDTLKIGSVVITVKVPARYGSTETQAAEA